MFQFSVGAEWGPKAINGYARQNGKQLTQNQVHALSTGDEEASRTTPYSCVDT